MTAQAEPDVVARRVLADSQSGAHAVLGLPPTASASDVRSRYKALAKVLHPDKARSTLAEDAFKGAFGVPWSLPPTPVNASSASTSSPHTPTRQL